MDLTLKSTPIVLKKKKLDCQHWVHADKFKIWGRGTSYFVFFLKYLRRLIWRERVVSEAQQNARLSYSTAQRPKQTHITSAFHSMGLSQAPPNIYNDNECGYWWPLQVLLLWVSNCTFVLVKLLVLVKQACLTCCERPYCPHESHILYLSQTEHTQQRRTQRREQWTKYSNISFF